MNRPYLSSLACAALTVASATAASATGVATPQSSTSARSSVRDLGPAPASLSVRLTLSLAYRNDAALDALIAAQQNPHSPLYRRYLTPAQFRAAFVDAGATARVERELRVAGFRVSTPFGDPQFIDAVAPASVVNRYFATDIHRIAQGAEAFHYANVRPAVVPRTLRADVFGVVGFDDLKTVATPVRRGARRAGAHPDAKFVGPDGAYGPALFAKMYDLPSLNGTDGSGRTAAVVIDADFIDADIAAFLKGFGVRRTSPLTRVLVDGGPILPISKNLDVVESTLDVETIASAAPGAAIAVYEIPLLSNAGITHGYAKIVSDGTVDLVNSSFGGCEAALGTAPRIWNHIARRGNAQGTTFVASSGDGGPVAYGCSGTSLSAPASSPHFTSVGGTTLLVSSATTYAGERGWWFADPLQGVTSGSGGGVSTIFPLPAYQQSVPGTIASGRNVPDVALDGDPNSGASFYLEGCWCGPIGGTSLSSPMFVAYLAQTEQLAGGTRLGDFNPTLYRVFRKYGYGSTATLFHDVNTGANPVFAAGPGYDLMTGIGSIDGQQLAQYLQ